MNRNLSQVATQLLGLWHQLGLNQKISLVLAAGVVAVGLGGLVLWSSQTEYALLYGRLDEGEASKVVAALDEMGIPRKLSGAGNVLVPKDKVHGARMQLASRGLPKNDGVGFEIFDRPNFGISDFVQRANYLRAVQGELARSISKVDSIDSASVMIVMPENRVFADGAKKSTASVFLRVRGNIVLPQQTVSAIRFLVAGAVEGLAVGNVSVVDNLGNVLSDNTPEDSVAGLTTTQLAARKNLEQYLTKSAQGMLDTVLGPGQSVVRVAAEINYDSLTRIEEKFDPEGQVPRTSQVTDESTVTTTQNPTSAAAGVVANATTETNNPASALLNSSNTKKKTTNSDFEINKTVDNIIQSAGGIKRLSAAVFIAAQVTGTGTNRVVAPRTPEELQKIRRVVQSALGLQEGADALRKDEITVEEMPFNDQPFALLTEQMHREQQRFLWLEYAQQGAFGLLAAVALLLFWRAYKKTPNEAIPLGVPVGELAAPGESPSAGAAATTTSHTAKPGVVTVEVLNQLIRENPANMTRAIRSWMAEGEKTNS